MNVERKHFKMDCDVGLGPGTLYIEFEGEWATRQAECYQGEWFSSNQKDYHSELGISLADQPLSRIGLGCDERISAEEFEEAWNQALAKDADD